MVRRRVVLVLSVGALLFALGAVGLAGLGFGADDASPRVVVPTGGPSPSPLDDDALSRVGATTAGPVGRAVCGSAALRSPYDYTGPAGPYRSGTPGLPTFGKPGTDFPDAEAGMVLPPETADYQNWQLKPRTVYYLAPGMHYGSFSANTGDVFVGGYANGRGSVLDGQYRRFTAIDSNITIGEQTDVTIAYLTIQKFTPYVDQTAINQTGAGGWRLLNSTVTLNVPGGGMFAATDAVVRDNCLTLNGQYGFQASETIRGDALTGGPYNVWVENNEISYNDTCGLSGLLQNDGAGLARPQPGPGSLPEPSLRRRRGERQPGRLQALGHQRRNDPGQLDPPQLGGGRLGRHEQRQHHLDRQHHHGQRERGRSGRRSPTTSPSPTTTSHATTSSTGRATRASRCPRSTSRSRGATRRTAASPRAPCRRASPPGSRATPTGSVIERTRWWTTVAGSSCGRTPTGTATTGSTARAR